MSTHIFDFFEAIGEKYEIQDFAGWAASTGVETMEELWLIKDMPASYRMLIATNHMVMTPHDLRMFAVWCAEQMDRDRNKMEARQEDCPLAVETAIMARRVAAYVAEHMQKAEMENDKNFTEIAEAQTLGEITQAEVKAQCEASDEEHDKTVNLLQNMLRCAAYLALAVGEKEQDKPCLVAAVACDENAADTARWCSKLASEYLSRTDDEADQALQYSRLVQKLLEYPVTFKYIEKRKEKPKMQPLPEKLLIDLYDLWREENPNTTRKDFEVSLVNFIQKLD